MPAGISNIEWLLRSIKANGGTGSGGNTGGSTTAIKITSLIPTSFLYEVGQNVTSIMFSAILNKKKEDTLTANLVSTGITTYNLLANMTDYEISGLYALGANIVPSLNSTRTMQIQVADANSSDTADITIKAGARIYYGAPSLTDPDPGSGDFSALTASDIFTNRLKTISVNGNGNKIVIAIPKAAPFNGEEARFWINSLWVNAFNMEEANFVNAYGVVLTYCVYTSIYNQNGIGIDIEIR
mgnify:FL=1